MFVQLDTKFQGVSADLQLLGRFRGRVKLQGPSIIAGLSELVKAGVAEPPLPDFLATLHSSAKNKFVVTDA